MKHPKIVAVLLTTMLAVLALGSTGCEEPGAPKVYRDPANTIYVEVNDEFVIALESNHSTGYSWQLLTDDGDSRLQYRGPRTGGHRVRGPRERPGGRPRRGEMDLQGAGTDRTYLHFAYVRPWETGAGDGGRATETGSGSGRTTPPRTATETG